MHGEKMLGQVLVLVCLALWMDTSAAAGPPPYVLDSALIYFSKVNFTVKNQETKIKKTLSFDTATVTSKMNGNTSMSLNLIFDESKGNVTGLTVTGFQLNMIVENVAGYWTATNYSVTANAVMDNSGNQDFKDLAMVAYDYLSAPLPMSFHCGRFGPIFPKLDPAVLAPRNFTPTVELIDFQFQAFMKNNTYFGNSYDCVGFFSIGILSGIFVTIMLMGILTWGLVMILNLNTMDRFDDPKGKQISVTATD